MNKYMKWFLIVLALFAVLFAVGCTKSVLEGKDFGETKLSSKGSGVSVGYAMPSIAVAQVDAGYDESYSGSTEPAMYRKGYMPPYYDNSHYGSGDDVDTSLQIIKSASVRLEVNDYFLTSQKVEAFAKKYKGYVSNSHAGTDYNNRKSGTVTIKVPELHFDAVIAELSLLGDIKSKTVTGQDVTEQYIDLQARVNNSKTYEARLLKMYDNATKVNEMMTIERDLSRVRGQIEQMQGQLRYMKNRVAMSSITVYLYEPVPVVKKWGVWQSVKNALNHSLATLRWMIELIGWLLPLVVVGVLIGLLVRVLRRKRRASVRKR